MEAEAGIKVASRCTSVIDALRELRQRKIDVAVVDLAIRNHEGVSFIRSARASGFKGPILALAESEAASDCVPALNAGASGVLLKDNSPDSLIRAINLVASGSAWVDPRVMQLIVRQGAGFGGAGTAARDREKNLIRDLCEGKSNRAIAEDLGISEGTVKSVLRQLFRRTGSKNRTQLVRLLLTEQPGSETE